MRHDRHYYVYILSSDTSVLYTGVTSDLRRRAFEHKHGLIRGFTERYPAPACSSFRTV